MKTCIKCNIEKDDINYILRKDTRKLNNTCKLCVNINSQKWFKEKSKDAKFRKVRNKKVIENRARLRDKWKEENNPKYRINLKKQQFYDITRKWKTNNPIWANLDTIKDIFINCPVGFAVDHIVPINGENFCGLHIDYNLQYLTPSDNGRKRNRLPEDLV